MFEVTILALIQSVVLGLSAMTWKASYVAFARSALEFHFSDCHGILSDTSSMTVCLAVFALKQFEWVSLDQLAVNLSFANDTWKGDWSVLCPV